MILRQVRLFPFGGVQDRQFQFERGLNVILGPNEAGKSTLVNAVFSALFFSSSIRKNSSDWKNCLSQYMPYPHGDTMRVSLTFTGPGGEEYTVARSWGEEQVDHLFLPGGSEVRGEKKIAEILLSVIGHGRGTFEAVFMVRQEELTGTVERLKENREAAVTLADLLRTASFQAGGLSVDELQAAVQNEKKSLLELWDLERDAPRGGRGIDNPYRKGLGEVISTYYEVESLKKEMADAVKLEKKVEEISARLQEASCEKQEVVEPQLKKMAVIEKDISARLTLDPRRDLLLEKEKALREVSEHWPRAGERLQNLHSRLQDKKGLFGALAAEKEEAQKVLASREKRALYSRVKPVIDELEAGAERLQKIPPVDPGEVKKLENASSKVSRLTATLEGMKLKGRVKVNHPAELRFVSGVKPPAKLQIEKEAALEAEGRILLEGADWSVEIQSGQGDVEQIVREIEQGRTFIKEALYKLSAGSIEAVQQMAEERAVLESEMERLRVKVEALLGDRSYAELQEAVAALEDDKNVREPAVIGEELKGIEIEINAVKGEIETVQGQLRGWEEKYGSYENIIDELAELRGARRDIEKRLSELAPLPEQFETPDQFLENLGAARDKSRQLDEQIYNLKIELNSAQNDLPEESAEELGEKIRIGQEKLARLKSRARALCVVERELQKLISEIDKNTFIPLRETLVKYLAPATAYRYDTVQMDGAIPLYIGSTGSTGSPGGTARKELPVDLLSTGAACSLALALRLAMAEHLWGKSGGLLVMDDPLVDLDPQRKKEAAAMLKDFSADRQLLITTFDPSTAALLGGKTVRL